MYAPEIITREELLRRLSIGDHRLAELRTEGLPTLQLGERDLRFSWLTVVAWLERHKLAAGSDRPTAPTAPLVPYKRSTKKLPSRVEVPLSSLVHA
jgi:hypothetical protein